MNQQNEVSEAKVVRIPRRNFISLPEIAAARGVSRVAVLYDIRSGKLKALRTPGRREWHIHVDEARRYLANSRPAQGLAVAA